MPQFFNDMRQDRTNNIDISMIKAFRIRERAQLQTRLETFNSLNHPQLGVPNTSPYSKAFGMITSTQNTPRVVQLGMRVTF
ncbi:MAG: hypothetical protein JO022_02885 [Acidobacteriaceae bacterium]|nr:hypothetical protein [Acidobacteriaceae bacterium]